MERDSRLSSFRQDLKTMNFQEIELSRSLTLGLNSPYFVLEVIA